MPDLEQSSKIFFHLEVKLVSPQRSKSIFSNKNRFSTSTEFPFIVFFQTKISLPDCVNLISTQNFSGPFVTGSF